MSAPLRHPAVSPPRSPGSGARPAHVSREHPDVAHREGAARIAWRILRQLFERIVIDPVRTGRIRRVDWPPGLAVNAALGLVCYLTAMTVGVAAPWLRAVLPSPHSTLGMPTTVIVALFAVLILTSALAVSAAWHAPWPLRVVGVVLPLPLLCVPAVGAGSSLIPSLVAIAGWLLLLAMAIWRSRRPYQWWELTAALLLLAAPMAVNFLLNADVLASPRTPALDALVNITLVAVGIFALPTLLVAGVAVSEVAFTSSAWVVEIVSTQVPRRLSAALLLLVSAGGLGLAVTSWQQPVLPRRLHLMSAGTTAIALVLAWGAWLVADRVADRRTQPSSTRLAAVVPQVRRVTIVLSILIALPTIAHMAALLVLLGIIQPLISLGVPGLTDAFADLTTMNSDRLRMVGYGFATVLAGGIGVRAARHGHRGRGELALIMAVLCAERMLRRAGLGVPPLSLDTLSALALAVTLLAAAVCLITRRMSTQRAEAFGVALLLSLAIRFRDLFSDPLGVALGGAGGALLVVGLVWNLLTNAEQANGHSERFPRPARVQAVLAGLSIAMLFYAYNAFTDPRSSASLAHWTTTGAEVFGTGLLLAGLFAALSAAWRNEEIVEPGGRSPATGLTPVRDTMRP